MTEVENAFMTIQKKESLDQLIKRLGEDLTPVEPLVPAGRRAAYWLMGMLCAGTALIYFMTGNPVHVIESMNIHDQVLLVAKVATGTLGVIAAFQLNVPGHKKIWDWLPLVPALIWLAMAGEACLSLPRMPFTDGSPLHYAECFGFVVGLGLPLSAALFWSLRHGYALEPRRTFFFGIMGIAGLVGAVMHCFHTQDGTVLDMLSHTAAICLLIGFGLFKARSVDFLVH